MTCVHDDDTWDTPIADGTTAHVAQLMAASHAAPIGIKMVTSMPNGHHLRGEITTPGAVASFRVTVFGGGS